MNFDGMDSVLKTMADRQIESIQKNGYAAPGNNGAYHCQDTPVRNSAHWCVTYEFLSRFTDTDRYKEIAKQLGDYIVSSQAGSKSGSIQCMEDTKLDTINGLIGQAWAMEGLLAAYRATGTKKYLEVACKVFRSQLFDEAYGYWKRVEMNGKVLGYDIAFNHQLWFAAVGAELLQYVEDNEIKKQIDIFAQKCPQHFRVSHKGRICHFGDIVRKTSARVAIKKKISAILPYQIWKKNPDRLHKATYEDSYQLFNLYGFAILYNNGYAKIPLFQSKDFKKALKYGLDYQALNHSFNVSRYESLTPATDVQKETAKFAYAYNSPAFEYGYVGHTFTGEDSMEVSERLMKIHNHLCYSAATKKFDRNTSDPETLTARIYELTRYLEAIHYGEK